MSQSQAAHLDHLDQLLARLEASIGLLSEDGAPLERLVAAHEEAVRLADAATRLLSELEAWAAATAAELAATAPGQ